MKWFDLRVSNDAHIAVIGSPPFFFALVVSYKSKVFYLFIYFLLFHQPFSDYIYHLNKILVGDILYNRFHTTIYLSN